MSDYISREAFKKKYLCCGYLPEMSEEEFGDFPAEDVEPIRYGHWKIRLADEMTLCLECSICGRKVDNIDLHHLLESGEYGEACRRYTYCHCGSKMDLEV